MDKILKHPLTIWLKYGPDNNIKKLYRTFIFVIFKLMFKALVAFMKYEQNRSKR